ncbi:MAG: hypothetical protein KIS92_22665 [Planctomycetota bacterium]|nr:hypothetical protein [Planctomycetota bacterium]
MWQLLKDLLLSRPKGAAEPMGSAALRRDHPQAGGWKDCNFLERVTVNTLELTDCAAFSRWPKGLTVRGKVTLIRCHNLLELPKDLHVAGSLFIEHCPKLRGLPEGLRVDGDLRVANCASFERIGAGARVKGITELLRLPVFSEWFPEELLGESLVMSDCPSVRDLALSERVTGPVKVQACNALTELRAARVSLRWDVRIESCAALKALPREVQIDGNLVLRDCANLEQMPETLRAWKVDLRDCPRVERLPERIEARTIELTRLPRLAHWPERVRAVPYLTVSDCRLFPGFGPEPLSCSQLRLLGCSAVQGLPERLSACELLEITASPWLTALPKELTVGWSLRLGDCHNLRALPEELYLSEQLSLRGCTGLTRMPRILMIGSPGQQRQALLDLRGCTGLREIPHGVSLWGAIDVAGSGIRSLPESLGQTGILWNGVEVDARIAFAPETLSADEVMAERNAEVRRIMMQRMGLARFMKEAKAHVLNQDRDAGGPRRLLRIHDGRQAIVCLHVFCPSTGREYMLRVPPHMDTCHEAAAWMAGFNDPSQYAPMVET